VVAAVLLTAGLDERCERQPRPRQRELAAVHVDDDETTRWFPAEDADVDPWFREPDMHLLLG
jgi:hypothetical protein